MNYDHIKETLNRALESSKGIRVLFETKSEATRFRHQCNSFRVKDRQDNAELYSPGDPLYGVSAYDELILTVSDNAVAIKRVSEPKIEEIE